MKKPIFKILLFGLLLGLLSGCGIGYLTYSHLIGFNPDRQIKHDSKKIRDLEVLLYAYYEGTQNGAHIKLRTDNYFDFFWHSAFGWSYYAGTWQRDNESDTIRLSYIQNHKPEKFDTLLVYTRPINRIDSFFCYNEKLIHLVTKDTLGKRNHPFCIIENKIFK